MDQICSNNSNGSGGGSDLCSGGGDDESSEPPNIDSPGPFASATFTGNKHVQKPIYNDDDISTFDFDHYLQTTLGEFGRYQQFIVWFLCIPACFLSAYGTLDMVFLAYTPSFTCNAALSHARTLQRERGGGGLVGLFSSNQSDEGSTLEDSVVISALDQCHYRVTRNNANFTSPANASNSDEFACSAWNYDASYFQSTIVTQWNLVCDKAITARTIVSLLNIAVLFAAAYSFISDRWGRKKAFFLSLSVFLFGSCGSLLAPTPFTFGFLKFIGGIACMWEICYVWALEFVGPSQRTALTTMLSVIYCVATMSLALLAYLCNTWMELGLCTSAPFILLYAYAIFIPESPRWLLAQGRVDDALKIIESMARWHNVKIDLVALRGTILGANVGTCNAGDCTKNELQPNHAIGSNKSSTALLVAESRESSQSPDAGYEAPVVILPEEGRSSKESLSNRSLSIAQFFSSTNLRWKSIFMTCIEVIANQLYYAIPYSLENLSANFYVSYVLQAAVEAPATLLNLLLLNRFGRVVPLSISLFLSGVCCLLTLSGGKSTGGWEWAPVVFVVFSRFFICTSVAITEQLGGELFPTVARGTGQGVSYFVSSFASISTQYILYASHVWPGLPMLIFGNLVLVASLMALFLPETMGHSLPDTLRQAEAQGYVGVVAFKRNVVPRLLAVFDRRRCCGGSKKWAVNRNQLNLPLCANDLTCDDAKIMNSERLMV